MTTLAQDGDLADIYLIGLQDSTQLSATDRARFKMLLGSLLAECDVAVDLYNRKMIDGKMMMPYTKFFTSLSLMQNPDVSGWWEASQVFFSGEMRSLFYEEIQR